MRIIEKDLAAEIKKVIREQVAPEDQKDFTDGLRNMLTETAFPPIEEHIKEKYGNLLTRLVDLVDEVDSTEGVNINFIVRDL